MPGSGVAQIFASNLSNADEVRSTLTRAREIAHGGRGNLRVLRVNDELREGSAFSIRLRVVRLV